MNKLIDPYEKKDVWLEFLDEDDYESYLKHVVWVTDGEVIESASFYKEYPFSIEMNSGKQATHWLFPSNGIDKSNPPKLKASALDI